MALQWVADSDGALCTAIAADDTRICLPETGAGMIPGVAGTQTASRRLGLGRALDLSITGRWIDAQDALLIGLVAEVVSVAKLESRALDVGNRLALLPRENTAIAKLAVWGGLDLPISEGLSLEQRLAYRLSMLSGRDQDGSNGGHRRWRKPRAARR